MVQIGSAFWLRIPVGKLDIHRYIRLHPQLKELLDDWVLNHRPARVRSDRLLVERNRPLTGYRLARSSTTYAVEAGLGHVTLHQLRIRPPHRPSTEHEPRRHRRAVGARGAGDDDDLVPLIRQEHSNATPPTGGPRP